MFSHRAIRAAIIHLRPSLLISGMAVGVDQDAAGIALEEHIPLLAAVPFIDQDVKWPLKERLHYQGLLRRSREVVVVSGTGYALWKYQKRNEFMVNRADLVLAVYDGSTGGTRNCVEYALRKMKPIITIDPRKVVMCSCCGKQPAIHAVCGNIVRSFCKDHEDVLCGS